VADLKQFRMPDIGEGLTEADIIKWVVAPGDTVTINQTLVEIETAKAAVELPSPFAGVVTELHAAPGDTVDVGRPIITIDVAPNDSSGPSGRAADSISVGREAFLVGYGPKSEDGPKRRRGRGAAAPAAVMSAAVTSAAVTSAAVTSAVAQAPLAAGQAQPVAAQAPVAPAVQRVLAKPPVRLLAKNLGVDLGGVNPTGPNGTVSREDVEHAADGPVAASGSALGAARHSGGGRETRVAVRGVRKHTAAAMVSSAFTAPHVTEFLTADVTAMMDLRARIGARPEFSGLKVSPLVLLAKAVIVAAASTPEINATWDEAAGEIVLKHYVNLGIAATTGRGLIVPNIKDADQLSLRDLAAAIGELTAVARAGTTTPADLVGGTITITNVGVFGVDTGTPILNPGESGIVAFGAVARRPWVVDEQVVPRWVTTLAVSFDHRVVDGAQGSQFLASVAGILSDPGLALL
jgi:2-oxoisovalerate dehydrogenase E2 component (dihydrolipoyl transacylase)